MKKTLSLFAFVALCLGAYAWESPIALPDVGDGRLRIVAQNAQNYHDNFVASNKSCWTDAEFTEKTYKMANVFNALQADIIAMCEVGRNDQSALGHISDAMNELVGGDWYTYVADNFSEEVAATGEYQSIKSGFVYNYNKLSAIGSSFSPYNGGAYVARMRVQLFMERETGEYFYLSMNHFKAKDATSDGGDEKRMTNVSYLLSSLSNLTKDPDILIMGDLNCYMGERPIIALEDEGYTEQLIRFNPNAYTYIYGGEKGILDHAMANESMAKQITGAAAYNINHAPDASYAYADHDAVVVGVSLAPETALDNVSTTMHAAHKVVINGVMYIMHDGKTYNITGQVVK